MRSWFYEQGDNKNVKENEVGQMFQTPICHNAHHTSWLTINSLLI